MSIALRERLERHQVAIYFATIAIAFAVALVLPTAGLADFIEPALALMLFVTFLQVPLADLGRALMNTRFMVALAVSNFIAVPLLVLALIPLTPPDPLVRLGILLVLLAPCIDYVVTFARIGGADAPSLLAATPALLVLQMLLLPAWLFLFLGPQASGILQIAPFVEAFVLLIALPLTLAAAVQAAAARNAAGRRLKDGLDHLTVPATALVLFLVIAGVTPQLGAQWQAALGAVPAYAVFALAAPAVGWAIRRIARLDAGEARAVALSSATRNSLVVMPLALSVPGAVPLLPAIIVAQTVVELIASLVYMKVMPVLGKRRDGN